MLKRRDDDLIREFLLNNSGRAFEILITRHLPCLRRLLFSIFAGNKEDMEDAEQEILIKLVSDLSAFKFQSSFKTFFYHYARNKAIDILRKKIRVEKKEDKIADIFLVTGSKYDVNEAELKLQNKEVSDALLKLDELSRILIVMKEIEGFSLKEISEATGLPEGTVKSRLHRAREQLVNLFKDV